MLAKLIVSGATRKEAHRAGPPRPGRVQRRRPGRPSSRSTARWSATRRSSATRTASRCTPAGSRPSGTTPSSRSPAAARSTRKRPQPRQKVVVEVGGRRVEVSLPGDLALGNGSGPTRVRRDPQEAEGPQARRRTPAPPRPATRSPRRCRAPWSRSPSRRVRGGDRRSRRGPGGHEDGEPGDRPQGRRHHRRWRRGRRRDHAGHGALPRSSKTGSPPARRPRR